MMPDDIILDIRDVSKIYVNSSSLFNIQTFNALDHVSLSIKRGKTLALVGESGSGKTTLSRIIMKLESMTSGQIFINCQEINNDINRVKSKEYYKKVQMIFQDPYSSLNPSKKIWQIITAPLRADRRYNKIKLFSVAEKYSQLVGLGLEYLNAYPRTLSGGQRQRVGIARALVLEPDLLILDEALAALDLSIQAQIINLLVDLQARLGLTYLFISNDMSMVEHFADQIAVMRSGRVIDFGDVSEVFSRPSHQYTRQLVGKSTHPTY